MVCYSSCELVLVGCLCRLSIPEPMDLNPLEMTDYSMTTLWCWHYFSIRWMTVCPESSNMLSADLYFTESPD
jgi:hypothetical protein